MNLTLTGTPGAQPPKTVPSSRLSVSSSPFESGRLSILGITGPIGCGKSTVARMTLDLGAVNHIDADAVVHELMQAGTSLTSKIGQQFGGEVLLPDGSVDRKRLGSIVFGDHGGLRHLERLVDPEVEGAIAGRLQRLEDRYREGVVTVEAVRLLDSPVAQWSRSIWLVQCSPEEQTRRLTRDRFQSQEEADQRMEAQPAFDMTRIDEIITNDSTVPRLRARVREAWGRTLWSRAD